jgi:hypothetical protein
MRDLPSRSSSRWKVQVVEEQERNGERERFSCPKNVDSEVTRDAPGLSCHSRQRNSKEHQRLLLQKSTVMIGRINPPERGNEKGEKSRC